MKTVQEKQHRRILILSVSLAYLAILSVWHNVATNDAPVSGSFFQPGNWAFTLWVAFFASLVAALIFVRNSSRQLKAAEEASSADDADQAGDS